MIPKIVIVDSGINSQIVTCDTIDILNMGSQDKNGHGTACASVIKKICPVSELISIPILDENIQGNSEGLEKALNECKKIDCNIINLSLAITDKCQNQSQIESICEDLKREGKIVVSSVQNGRNKSLPAAFKSVIGVKGKLFQNINRYWFDPKKSIQLITDMTPCFTEAIFSHYFIFSGNSKAAAVATGIIALGFSYNDLFDRRMLNAYLRKNAEKKYWEINDEEYSINELKVNNRNNVDKDLMYELYRIFKCYLKIETEFANDDNLFDIGEMTYISLNKIIQDVNGMMNLKLTLFDMQPKDFISINNFYSVLRRKICIKH